ncbi:UDP-3-O-(3-hydroxymyristoyl)glucosamine N-acyltransferase [Pseudanabaena sp. ABRG5-3]|uniref:UDP-3-O-(3-hydroxymyristoyl)glucosamine N-acyltransferase n=1 Tax=Pseudanabaena sp. ABRG5-3 TaxID=685565 RepID=UPI000DC73B69|nr:UDP-3-O-(3-hydroxymyristoyl)glucosamine N-acyltransferase [Pseudanabaena sp. ABRG5-3]BBC22726.1 UDP-3-O-[3-hydroxymyristoyl] glucosamine N-acyltransferase [Pseudanabaena sp. ABRG5-3]
MSINSINLDALIRIVPVLIKSNSSFSSLGSISHSEKNMLVFLESSKFISKALRNPEISCILTNSEIAEKLPNIYGIAISDNPRYDFFSIHNYLALETDFYWQDFESRISKNVSIHPTAYVASKNVVIGDGSIIEANVNILDNVIIGENVIIRSGSTIGSQGFEFKRIKNEIMSIAHAGGVKICDRVEIQANCAISKAIFGGFTEIGKDTKLDNLVHVAHNVKIGSRCLIAASATISGSSIIGDDVWIGPNSCISNEITVGDGAEITIGSVVVQNVPSLTRVTGNFAIDHKKFLSLTKIMRRYSNYT